MRNFWPSESYVRIAVAASIKMKEALERFYPKFKIEKFSENVLYQTYKQEMECPSGLTRVARSVFVLFCCLGNEWFKLGIAKVLRVPWY